MSELMTLSDYENEEKRYQMKSDVVSGVINPTPVFEYIDYCKAFGDPTNDDDDIEVPAYAREVAQFYL